jgi:hypothetical protein
LLKKKYLGSFCQNASAIGKYSYLFDMLRTSKKGPPVW